MKNLLKICQFPHPFRSPTCLGYLHKIHPKFCSKICPFPLFNLPRFAQICPNLPKFGHWQRHHLNSDLLGPGLRILPNLSGFAQICPNLPKSAKFAQICRDSLGSTQIGPNRGVGWGRQAFDPIDSGLCRES